MSSHLAKGQLTNITETTMLISCDRTHQKTSFTRRRIAIASCVAHHLDASRVKFDPLKHLKADFGL